jgi:hypothetical protein
MRDRNKQAIDRQIGGEAGMRQRDKEKENKSDGSSLGVSKAQEDTV